MAVNHPVGGSSPSGGEPVKSAKSFRNKDLALFLLYTFTKSFTIDERFFLFHTLNMKKKLYRFRLPKQLGKYQVQFYHIPGKWISTGTADITEAVLFAEAKLKEDLYGLGRSELTLQQFAEGFFTEADPYKLRMRDRKYGKNYAPYYYYQKQGFLDNYILPRFGRYLVSGITDVAIENWFLDLKSKDTGKDLSDDTKNKILITLRIVLQEAHRQGLVSQNTAEKVKMINEKNEERKPFTKEEMILMFPYDDDELVKVWKDQMWATYFLIMRDTGFRPGEVAGLKISSYYPDQHGVYSEDSVNFRERKLQHSIKTSKKGQKYKVGILTSQTERFVQARISACREKGEEYLFLIKGKYMEPSASNKHFKTCVDSLMERDGRTQYCLRHSFETDLAGSIEDSKLTELMAHTGFNPVYDHRTPETRLSQLQPVREILEKRH